MGVECLKFIFVYKIEDLKEAFLQDFRILLGPPSAKMWPDSTVHVSPSSCLLGTWTHLAFGVKWWRRVMVFEDKKQKAKTAINLQPWHSGKGLDSVRTARTTREAAL